jgi:hypothetical protein
MVRHAPPHRAAMSRAAAGAPACVAAARSLPLPPVHPAQAVWLPQPAPRSHPAAVRAARCLCVASLTTNRTARAAAAPDAASAARSAAPAPAARCVPPSVQRHAVPVRPHAHPRDPAATGATQSHCWAAQRGRAASACAKRPSTIANAQTAAIRKHDLNQRCRIVAVQWR